MKNAIDAIIRDDTDICIHGLVDEENDSGAIIGGILDVEFTLD